MSALHRRAFLESSLLAAGAVVLGSRASWAAVVPGVEIKGTSTSTGEERVAQPDLWTLEINFKPVRMITVDLPDPKTGDVSKQLVWYMVYRAIRRPTMGGEKAQLSFDNAQFVPEFLFVTDDNGKEQQTYYDRIIPAAQAAISKRERREYKNSVEVVGPMPEETPYGAKIEHSLDGVATWRGVDPTVAKFKVFMSGLSNGYKKVEGPDGKDVIQRKTLVQEFWRPGDEFEQNEQEIRVVESPKWIYR